MVFLRITYLIGGLITSVKVKEIEFRITEILTTVRYIPLVLITAYWLLK